MPSRSLRSQPTRRDPRSRPGWGRRISRCLSFPPGPHLDGWWLAAGHTISSWPVGRKELLDLKQVAVWIAKEAIVNAVGCVGRRCLLKRYTFRSECQIGAVNVIGHEGYDDAEGRSIRRRRLL